MDAIRRGNPGTILSVKSGAAAVTVEKARIRLPDNARLIAAVLQDTRTDMTLQIEQPVGNLDKQAKAGSGQERHQLGEMRRGHAGGLPVGRLGLRSPLVLCRGLRHGSWR